MQPNNPYEPPKSVVADPPPLPDAGPHELAGRGARLGAALLDTLFLLVLVLPAMFVGGYFGAVAEAQQSGENPPLGLMIAWAAVSFAIFVALQGFPLHHYGQTWGKRILGIRIADLDGGKPPLGLLLTRRYVPIQVANLIPVVGPLLVLVDTLMIFRGDRRCAHDLIAGTRVVKTG